MWHPKQLLKPEIVAALRLGGLTVEQIEFLGWLNGTSSALNKSRNPVKAAKTLLSRIGDEEEAMHKMAVKFRERKIESIKPKDAETHEAADQFFNDLHNEIADHMRDALITSPGYVDYTKGGVSNGDEPEEESEPEGVESE
jgi:hypothetical protein